jgi:hypothetical protein
LEREFDRLVEAVVARLDGRTTVRGTRLRERWRVAHTDLAEIAGRLGVDDESITTEDQSALRVLATDPDREIILGIAEGSAADTVPERLSEARAVRQCVPNAARVTATWRKLEDRLQGVRLQKPWLTGWAAAGEFREAVGLGGSDAPGVTFRRLLEERCGWPEVQQIADLPFAPTGVEAVHLKFANDMPVTMTVATQSSARRFRLARSLYYFLFMGGTGSYAVADSAILPGARSEANAFATELLAPVERLRAQAPPHGVWTNEQRRSIARELGVGHKVIDHQIENHRLGVMA